MAIQSLAVWLFSGREAATAQWASRPPRPLRPGGAPPLAYAARQKGVPPRAYLWQGPGFYTLLIRATLALYDTVGAYGYQRREGKIATFPF